MTGSMPYVANVASLVVVESLFNGDGSQQHKLGALAAIDTAEHLMDAALHFSDTPELRAQIAHINVDWFGLRQTATGWDPQLPYDPSSNPTTGFWDRWYIEDAEGICREGAVAALKLALGLDQHGNPTRNDRVTVQWICAVDRFDVVLRRWSDNTLVSFITPGLATESLAGDLASGPFSGSTNYACPPADFTKQNALWIVGQCNTSGHYHEYVTSGQIVTVQPSIEDGGVH
jgi:hypothetical protein